MYTVAVQRNFIAQHFLTVGQGDPENENHAHHYVVEVQLEGSELDKHGYLVDICKIESVLDILVDHFRDKTLNKLQEFEGLNPSLEHFARIMGNTIADKISGQNLNSLTVKIWENDLAWAGYRKDL
jgi:6-pyruvoyltetrahydropterin/6-carboxytetrahydropterin synthase